MNLIRRILCKHEYAFIRNIYGDEINMAGGKRSWWRCRKCGKWKLRSQLGPECDGNSPFVGKEDMR